MKAALHHPPSTAARISSGARQATSGPQPVRTVVALWRRRWRERGELAALTQAELRDAGLTPYDARVEARKPFWRA